MQLLEYGRKDVCLRQIDGVFPSALGTGVFECGFGHGGVVFRFRFAP